MDASTIDVPVAEAPQDERSVASAGHASGYEFELPIGYIDDDGRVHRTAVLRKMTGREEAIMTDRRTRNSAGRMISELLANCIVRLGALEAPDLHIAQSLYSADRHYLLLKLREITFGPELQATYSCPTCHESLSMTESIDELEVRRLDAPPPPPDIVVELVDGYADAASGETFHSAVFRYPQGMDEEKTASAARENVSLGKNALLARCLLQLGDISPSRLEALGTSIFRELTLGDRARIDRALSDRAPGIETTRSFTCPGCGRQFEASLDLSGFLALS